MHSWESKTKSYSHDQTWRGALQHAKGNRCLSSFSATEARSFTEERVQACQRMNGFVAQCYGIGFRVDNSAFDSKAYNTCCILNTN